MNKKLTIFAPPEQTLFLCEFTIPPDLVTAYENRIAMDTYGFPNEGAYVSETEVELDKQWVVFSGSVIPTGWHEGNLIDPGSTGDIATIKQLLTGGRVVQVSPVTATGQIAGPIVAGDDYLAANGRAFVFYFAPQTFDLATAEFWFGGQTQRGTGWLVQGTVEADTLDGEAVWKGTAELTQEETSALQPRIYNWSAQVRNGTSEVITQRIGVVRVVRGFTPVVQS
jgi:hypothetical protein